MRTLLVPATLVLLTGCTGYRVKHDYDLRTDFRAYRTYDWTEGRAEGRKAAGANISQKRVVYHADQVLGAKGFKLERQGDPDFLIAFTPIWGTRQERTRTTLGAGLGFRFGPLHVGTRTTVGESRKVAVGSILLEVIDFKTKQVVWEGTAEGALSDLDRAQDADEKAADAVRRLLEDFPPRSK